ncbi:MAG TPA: hypothetical protein PK331_08945 [Gordonia sp. (in: high G+C Gram-positive bacteria)]|uniref:hypothetical protein n=1 Tax=unclassified Gordonia (in: high G+C Gram-positive bacteria) TaxID=2657482 RepID=UPI0025C44E23|nr:MULTISPECIES: hypothetical protein [unclassified Gordonia (in: high G+C Gram-positive bacteria)]HNP55563.1 hypothetical protein [Gordonia sp. (in: high G+C Gram-positive bacteria)]HRC51033.1 hypothetical protein [Gordonia sp. (in: high G+C Gram-positive bacteria)]
MGVTGYDAWLRAARRRGADDEELAAIATSNSLRRDAFDILGTMTALEDGSGRSYFLVPPGMSGADVARAAWLTYVWNAGTGYGDLARRDFAPTPFSADEVLRIKARQAGNAWSYARAVRVADAGGARLVTTPTGMLMGAGGNAALRMCSQLGGTTWGDIFLINSGARDAGPILAATVEAGRVVYRRDGQMCLGRLPLDRLLHHEEIHADQWAQRGPARFASAYLREALAAASLGRVNRFEAQAGLSDGGYVDD